METYQYYHIRIQGHLDDRWGRWFEGFELARRGDETVISGLMDHAALFGVLGRIRDLGLILIAVERGSLDTRGNPAGEPDPGA